MADTHDQGIEPVGAAGAALGIADFAQASQEVAQSAGSVVGAWLESVAMNPVSIQSWLDQFGHIIQKLAGRRNDLIEESATAATIAVGDFPPSLQIRTKMADRMGTADGGLAKVITDILEPLETIHEAFKQSLEAYLHTDFDNAARLGQVGR
jgi:hypothetical protein